MHDDDTPELTVTIGALEILAFKTDCADRRTRRLSESAYIALRRLQADGDRHLVRRAIEEGRSDAAS